MESLKNIYGETIVRNIDELFHPLCEYSHREWDDLYAKFKADINAMNKELEVDKSYYERQAIKKDFQDKYFQKSLFVSDFNVLKYRKLVGPYKQDTSIEVRRGFVHNAIPEFLNHSEIIPVIVEIKQTRHFNDRDHSTEHHYCVIVEGRVISLWSPERPVDELY